MGGECERGGSSAPCFMGKIDAPPPGCDEEFLPMYEDVLGNKKSACLDESNTDAKTRIFGILNKNMPIISTTNFS